MSYALDANILLYASDESSPRHRRALTFLSECVADSEIMYVAWMTVSTYLRIATHPRIFTNPLTPRAAMGNVEGLLAHPHVRTLAEDEGFWTHYREVSTAFPVRGNLVPDAHLVALLHQHGVRELYSADTDFRKFDAIEPHDPFAEDAE